MPKNETTAEDAAAAARKAEREAKRDFELHVMLIVIDKNVSAGKARFMAWVEGPEGLKKRLSRMTTEPTLAL